MNSIAVVPGSFDPVTLGHLDVIRRTAGIFDEVHVLVVHNPGKVAMFTPEQRVDLIERSIAEQRAAGRFTGVDGTIQVHTWSEGLLVDYLTKVGSKVVVKGIRSQIDVAYETPMVLMNRSLAGVETVFLLPDPHNAHVSSSLVRQVAKLGGDPSEYVSAAVADFLAVQRQA